MSKGIFVTATDTGVGKTIVSAAIVRALRRCGINAGAMKPIESGCTRKEGILEPSDGRYLKIVAGMDDPLELITPVRFEAPLSPYCASQAEGTPVDLETIFEAYGTLSGKYDFMVVEGIGGVLVPLAGKTTRRASWTYFVTDLIKDLKLPAVVVTRPSLGTINHTLLTVNYLLSEGIDIAGVIINFSARPEGTIAEKTNPQALRELCSVPILGIIPCLKDISTESIEEIAAGCIDVSALIRHS